ncbi:hypothetical protein APSETT444_003442 [Aspergillus pseudonomiae]
MPYNPFAGSYFIPPENLGLGEDWKNFTDLKNKKPSLKAYLSVFQFTKEDNHWPNTTRSFQDRKYFIDKFVKLMEIYGFDGLDLDLSSAYIPEDSPDEAKNFVALLKELRESFGNQYGLSATVAATECIEHSLRRLQEANIDPNKLSMGLDLAADTDHFEDPKCNTPGCPSVPLEGQGFSAYELERIIERESPEVHYNESSAYSWFIYHVNHDYFDVDRLVRFKNAEALKKRADLANKHCIGGLLAYIAEGGPASLRNPNDLDPSDKSMRGAPLTNDTRYSTMDTPFTPSTQSASLSTETNSDADANGNTEGLSCHPAIGSVHVPIAQLDCDSNSTSIASHNSDAPVNAEEGAPSPSPTAPHETGTPDEPSATGPKPTLTVAHRIGSPIDSTKKADDEGTTPGEPTAAS